MSDAVTRIMLATRLDPGTHLNDTYEIDERIASGGMGEVYKGHNIQTGEPVAIKTILPELADQEAIFALFKREATVLNRLYHDTIVRYYSFSRDPRLGRTYLAMEFVDGISLADRMTAQPLAPSEVRRLFPSVADGLALAHGAGVIHRDLSPDNIILREGDVGRPKIIDFGIARSANIGEGTLIGGGFAGKYNFVSPEQLGIKNREVDGRSDIYSLALVIAASLRGKPLDMGGSHVDVIDKRSRLPDLSDIDESVRPLIEAMLQPNPDDRPADASVVAEWLRASTPPEERVEPAGRSFTGVTGAAAIGWPTQPGLPPLTSPGLPPAAPGLRTGTPFAGEADATQIVTGAAATPAAAATSPAGGESPFGSMAAYPPTAAGLSGAPPFSAAAQAAPPAGRKSGAGLYAIAGGVLLLLLGGGAYGAYVAGLIGSSGGTGGPPTAEQTQPAGGTAPAGTAVATAEPAATGTDASPPEASDQKDASAGQATADAAQPAEAAPEAQPAAGQSVDTGASADQATTTSPAGTAPAEAATPAVESPADTALVQPADLSPAATDQAVPQAAQPDGTSTTTAEPVVTEPPKPDKEVQVAAAGLTKMNVGVSWLRQYDGGKCFFAAVTSVSDRTINIKSFGTSVPAFQKLYSEFIQTNGIEPDLNGQLINEAQCAAADFLKAVQPAGTNNPQLELASDRLRLGDVLRASVDNAKGRMLDILLVDGDGLTYNVKSFADEEQHGDQAVFKMPLVDKIIDRDTPEMVIAITSPSGLAVPQGKEHIRAAALFPKLLRQIDSLGGDVGVDFAYFRLKP
jgi:serine/threonine-protein kinase